MALKGTWAPSGIKLWGGEIPVETGRVCSKLSSRQMRIGPQEGAIAALAKEFSSNKLQAFTTDVIDLERFHQPCGRFTGMNYGDFSLLSKIKYQKIITLNKISFSLPEDDVIEKLRECLNHQGHYPEFLNIKNALPDKSSQDAWHLYCVKNFGLDIFLTTDLVLLGQIKSIPDRNLKSSLMKIVRTPIELCADLGVDALSECQIISFAREKLDVDSF